MVLLLLLLMLQILQFVFAVLERELENVSTKWRSRIVVVRVAVIVVVQRHVWINEASSCSTTRRSATTVRTDVARWRRHTTHRIARVVRRHWRGTHGSGRRTVRTDGRWPWRTDRCDARAGIGP
uniref:Putative secreted peptide n=1 Tax=Anopheles braziliensis TaxID=58242 RepID=A0A2M3ZPY0_9DIPT